MNLFLETPQQAADRLARERRWRSGGVPSAPGARSTALDLDEAPGFGDSGPGGRVVPGGPGGPGCGGPVREGGVPGPASDPYSIAGDAYCEERAYDRARARRRKIGRVVRTLALIVLVPVAIALVFVGTYALTCIMSGAGPDEIPGLMASLLERVRGVATDLAATW